jgi:hypothetical protein
LFGNFGHDDLILEWGVPADHSAAAKMVRNGCWNLHGSWRV